MADTLVVIPTYNERITLPEVVARVLSLPLAVDVLIVDDNSPDGTGKLADELAAVHDNVHTMHRPGKSGLGPAYRAGLGWGLDKGYDILVEMDADLSHDPGHLPAMLAAVERADLVIGSRYVPGGGTQNWPWHRRALSSGGNRYVQVATGIPVRDATSGYRAFHRAVLEEIGLRELQSDGYSFQLETVLAAWRMGFAVDEVPITFVERRAGASKISRSIVLEALWRVLIWGLRGPRRAMPRHTRSVLADD
jgi:glycosyltransferase involved in cell wall biosynthesis